MNKLVFSRTKDEYRINDVDEVSVSFDGENIFSFKTACMRIAAAVGFTPFTIESAFGDESDFNVNNIDISNLTGSMEIL